jgi:hypothetical protein
MNDRTYRDAFNDRWNHLMASDPVATADRQWGEGEQELLERWRARPWQLVQLDESLRLIAERFVEGLRTIAMRMAELLVQGRRGPGDTSPAQCGPGEAVAGRARPAPAARADRSAAPDPDLPRETNMMHLCDWCDGAYCPVCGSVYEDG